MLLLMERLNLTQLERGFAVEVGSLDIPLVGRWSSGLPPSGSGCRVNPGSGPFVLRWGGETGLKWQSRGWKQQK